jgi:hypothetical protein
LVHFCLEDGSKRVPCYTASHPRRLYSYSGSIGVIASIVREFEFKCGIILILLDAVIY